MKILFRWPLPLVVALLNLAVDAQAGRQCYVGNEPVVPLEWDVDQDQYVPSDDYRVNDTFGMEGSPQFIEARLCSCGQGYFDKDYYCKLDQPYCWIPSVDAVDARPLCKGEPPRASILTTWKLVFVALATVIIYCFCAGHPIDFLMDSLSPTWSKKIAKRILEHNSDRANNLIRRGYKRNLQALEQRYRDMSTIDPKLKTSIDKDMRPLELLLRTKVYTSNWKMPPAVSLSSVTEATDLVGLNQEDQAYGHACTLCHTPINEGDRVGLLRCNHVSHAECLKGWLAIHNVCPLCMHPQAAMEHF